MLAAGSQISRRSGKSLTECAASELRIEFLRQQPKEIARGALTLQPARSVLRIPGARWFMRATQFFAICRDDRSWLCIGASTPIRIGVANEL